MDLKQAYEFLKPSLDQCTEEEKREFCRMILGEMETKKKAKISEREKSIARYKKLLLKSHFKSKV